ncbi:two-component system sensor histidine kinase YesM [Paenibacillus endophyticus]|uniref:Two-component system sensor histidine kinase YesM n=1 Tax=Paenibacillus endophyticus TaxID=1294268 RepID=A0A7W5CA42_9BACL|nr:sensor histidine kinase [Paenibacillus endophyticus]MBB3153947.1 two-component system sensor histidine kinase YesM [Paenibacillus endophyticus]
MHKITKLFRNLSVTWKFVATFLCILAVSLSACGIYLYLQLSGSAVSQAQMVMEQNLLQTRNSLMNKMNMIQNISKLLTSDIRLQTFLGSDFNKNSFAYDDYTSNISPYVENVLRQNPSVHSLRVYMTNPSIPEIYDSFYQISRIEDQPWVREVTSDDTNIFGWRGLHTEKLLLNIPKRGQPENVFSFYQKINSIRYFDTVGLLEIEILESDLFDILNSESTGQIGELFMIDRDNHVVSSNKSGLFKQQITDEGLAQLPIDTGFNQVLKVNGRKSVVISVPLHDLELRLIGIFPVSGLNEKVKESAFSITGILLIALVVLGFVVYFITNALLSRLKRIVLAMKRVKEGSLTVSVPVQSNDEFSQIAISFNHMTERIHELVETVYKSQLMEREAELKALESQVNPHFLYNTLATISWVARKANSTEIVHLSGALAQFYRLVLNKGRREILIKDELEMVKAYLAIQKFRFEEMFDVVYDIDERVYEYCVVKNILQPIVENALNHGIEPKRDRGTLQIKASLEADDMLCFKVIDDGVGMSKERLAALLVGNIERTSGSGYAVKNITERLNSYYGDKHAFRIHSAPGIGTSVMITFAKERA